MIFALHEQRVIDEHRDLTEKLNKLRTFFDTPIFRGLEEAEQMRLRAQAGFMDGYQDMLRERIRAFMETNATKELVSVAECGCPEGMCESKKAGCRMVKDIKNSRS